MRHIEIPAPEILYYDDLREEVADFVERFKIPQKCPIAVEWIADVRLGLNIVTVPGLRRDRGIEGYLSADRTTIYVDEDVANHPSQNRYRFTIAHEIGHWFLHQDLYKAWADCTGISYTQFINAIDDDDLGWYEYQAYAFGALLLVPREPLALAVEDALEFARANGMANIDVRIDDHRDGIARHACKGFKVSHDVVVKRGMKDGHWPDLPRQFGATG